MKNNILLCALMLLTGQLFGQAFWTEPALADIDLDQPVKVYIDLSQTTNNTLSGLLDSDPNMDIYLWAWGTSSTSDNGSWTSSNEDRKMTKETGKVYSYTFGPSFRTFWAGQGDEAFFGKTFGCLAKAKDGSGSPEKKTEDLAYTIPAPVIGPQLHITHPVKYSNDTLMLTKSDVVTYKYNNSLDTLVHHANMGQDDVYVLAYCTVAGSVSKYYVAPLNNTGWGGSFDTNPALKMNYVGNSEYHLSFIPEQLFANAKLINGTPIPAGSTFDKFVLRIYRKRTSTPTGNLMLGVPEYPFFVLPD